MAKRIYREKAQRLRKQGYSIGEIAKKLYQPKSTVSYWCKNIELSEKQINEIQKRHKSKSVETLLTYSENKRKLRKKQELELERVGKREIGKLSQRDLYMLGLGLYWGEGYKYAHSEFGFTNSDSGMIKTYISWLESVYGINKSRLICRISINIQHKDRIKEVEDHWIKVTGLTAGQFTKASFIKTVPKKEYENEKIHFGTLRVKVSKGKDIKNRVLGSLRRIVELNQ